MIATPMILSNLLWDEAADVHKYWFMHRLSSRWHCVSSPPLWDDQLLQTTSPAWGVIPSLVLCQKRGGSWDQITMAQSVQTVQVSEYSTIQFRTRYWVCLNGSLGGTLSLLRHAQIFSRNVRGPCYRKSCYDVCYTPIQCIIIMKVAGRVIIAWVWVDKRSATFTVLLFTASER